GEMAVQSHLELALLVSDTRSSLSQLKRNLLAARQRRLAFPELSGPPVVVGILMIGNAGDAVSLPHLLEESRAVPFPVKHDHKACTIAVSVELLGSRLARNVSK